MNIIKMKVQKSIAAWEQSQKVNNPICIAYGQNCPSLPNWYILDSEIFTEDNIAIGKEVSENLRILSAETATSLLTELRTYFCVAGENYYFDYLEKLSSVTRDDMVAFIDKYITGKNPVVSVYVNPAVYELLADSFSAAGYKTVLREGSIWHENKGKKK